MDITIRKIQKQEYPLLDNFLYEAIFVPAGIEPPPKTIITSPELQVYVEHFGELKDDLGLVAEVDGKIAGAVWVRIMNDYGHIDDETPSLAISLYKEYRGFGIGTAMLKEILALLKAQGYKQVSLSVQKANYAAKLYLKIGFEIVKENEEELIMVYHLASDDRSAHYYGGNTMDFLSITSSDTIWKKVSQFAQNCSWSAGKSLSQNMSANIFTDWERVIVALHGNDIAGYCTVAKSDCIPNVPYTPYIGYMFVDEKYRGQRLSQKLISYAMSYLQTQGFQQVFLVSDHENFYEKYGFKVIDTKMAPWGKFEKIYMHKI